MQHIGIGSFTVRSVTTIKTDQNIKRDFPKGGSEFPSLMHTKYFA